MLCPLRRAEKPLCSDGQLERFDDAGLPHAAEDLLPGRGLCGRADDGSDGQDVPGHQGDRDGPERAADCSMTPRGHHNVIL